MNAKASTQGHRYRVRLLSGQLKDPFVYADVLFAPDIPAAEADAVLALSQPFSELLQFKGPRFWWGLEALPHSCYRTPDARLMRRSLRLDEWIHFAHPDPALRVPVWTHFKNFTFQHAEGRKPQAIAVVSNFGGTWWRLKPGLRLRNRFILHPHVELRGREETWTRFRNWGPLSPPRPPPNYRGALPSWNMCRATIASLSAYQVVVCLENRSEPLYFTEKFVQAVQAGAIPIYHAHPSVREGVMKGARWIDPADHGFNAEATLTAALASDLTTFQEQNFAWFRSDAVARTSYDSAWKHVAGIVRSRIEGTASSQGKDILDRHVLFRRPIFS